MCKLISISKKSIWDKRSNLTNKPSLSFRSIEVVQYIMKRDEVALGVAIEKLFTTDGLYDEVLEELKEDYSDI
jgi:hypothetical protein